MGKVLKRGHLCTRHNAHELCRSKKCTWANSVYVKDCKAKDWKRRR